LVDRRIDHGRPVAAGRPQHHAGAARVDDDRHAILGPQRIDEHPHRRLHERQPVLGHHRSRHVEQEGQVARRRLFFLDRRAAQSDERELVLRIPGRRRELGRDRHRRAVARRRVVVLEVVDQLLDADGVRGREPSIVEEATDVGV
jgi:hypothetical protein